VAVVLITGASQGIGRATAIELARRGHEVVATARNVADLAELDAAKKLKLDVTKDGDVRSVLAEVGAVDVLLNNAGALVRGSVEATPLEEFEALYALNTIGALRVTKAFLPGMREARRGRVLFLSSVLGRLVLPGASAYAATKWAIEGIAETLALETARFGISVGVVEPGAVGTGGVGPQVAEYQVPGDPYAATEESASGGPSAESVITPAQAAREIADVVEAPSIALRTPIGDASRLALRQLRAAPDNHPFAWSA
jgi:NAD(P)-dependent dehydrogenase (short-subunit alcohol dehydrogenase family)